MKKISSALVLVAALCGARTASATTYESYIIQGNSCVSTTVGNTPVYSQFGPYNTSTTTGMNLTCPLTLPSHTFSYAYILLAGYNRNSSATKLSCSINGTDVYGNSFLTGKAALANNSPYVQIASTSIYPSTSTGNGWLYLSCYIPPATSSGVSHVTTISLTTGY
ncbi:MAG TPA: hypothetical protein VJ385_12965 [Fibrobacteria bacterium]|nr:hypothetical protein [Fibrobacteria bacterium]